MEETLRRRNNLIDFLMIFTGVSLEEVNFTIRKIEAKGYVVQLRTLANNIQEFGHTTGNKVANLNEIFCPLDKVSMLVKVFCEEPTIVNGICSTCWLVDSDDTMAKYFYPWSYKDQTKHQLGLSHR